MLTAHHTSWQRSAILAVALGLAACVETGAGESIWPPVDFELRVEEVKVVEGTARTVREVRVFGDGLVVYGTSGRAVVDAETGTALAVFDRLCAYQLVPTSIRAFARRLDALGVTRIDTVQGERGDVTDVGVKLTWQAFERRRELRAVGRPSGPMSEIMATVEAHLPDGERFELTGQSERVVLGPLRGVPKPVADAGGAQQAFEGLIEYRPTDEGLLLSAFALACSRGSRADAERLLAKWEAVTEDRRKAAAAFPDQPGLAPAILRRMLPPR